MPNGWVQIAVARQIQTLCFAGCSHCFVTLSTKACLKRVLYSCCGTRMQCAVSTSSPLAISDSANTPLAVCSPVQGVRLTMYLVMGIRGLIGRWAAKVAVARKCGVGSPGKTPGPLKDLQLRGISLLQHCPLLPVGLCQSSASRGSILLGVSRACLDWTRPHDARVGRFAASPGFATRCLCQEAWALHELCCA